MFRKLNRRFRVKLYNARMEKLWTIEETAAAAGVDKQTYSRWESGKQQPHLSSLRLLCEVFHKRPEELGF